LKPGGVFSTRKVRYQVPTGARRNQGNWTRFDVPRSAAVPRTVRGGVKSRPAVRMQSSNLEAVFMVCLSVLLNLFATIMLEEYAERGCFSSDRVRHL
jgi:hypothetical protein